MGSRAASSAEPSQAPSPVTGPWSVSAVIDSSVTQSTEDKVAKLVAGVVARERRLMARCLRRVDDDPELGRAVALELHDHLTGAAVIGITGNPGAGKSTVVDG